MGSLEFINQDELLAEIELRQGMELGLHAFKAWKALRAAVELHKPIPSFTRFICAICMQRSDDDYEVYDSDYPCSTIQAIEKELI